MTAPLDPNMFKEVPLFEGLTTQEMNKLRMLLRRRSLPVGANFVDFEQPGEIVYVIIEGTVKVFIEDATGGSVILAILGPGETVGEMGVVDSLGRSATVITLEPTTLFWIDRSSFLECMETMPALTFNLVKILSRRLRIANAQVQSLATRDVYGRVAHQLLAFAHEYGRKVPGGDIMIPIRLTQSDLADLVGASRVRINQVLGFYRQQNYISLDNNYRITVHNPEALANRAQ